jgi:hypothetical protein
MHVLLRFPALNSQVSTFADTMACTRVRWHVTTESFVAPPTTPWACFGSLTVKLPLDSAVSVLAHSKSECTYPLPGSTHVLVISRVTRARGT